MKILFINPPMQVNMKPEIPSLGISFITHSLKKYGHDITVSDIDGNRYNREYVSGFLAGSDAEFVGIGGLVTVYPYLKWLVPEIRRLKPGIEIMLGGAVASSLREKCFDSFGVDYIVIGEGEITACELVREISGGRDFALVKGIGYRDKGGKAVITESRPLMESLDDLPFFDDTLFPMDIYLRNTGGVLQIHTQRGCPGVCTFCFNCFRVVANKVRYRPYEKVVDEIEYFKKRYEDKIKLFAISGECITLNKDWLIGFCREILKRRLKIAFRVTSRVDTIDRERLEWLKKSGCVMMSLGLESGSPKILKIMKKGATPELGKKAVRLAKKYIKDIEACIILGYIGEDEHTLKETVRFCKEIGVRPSLFFATPFPGTELYRMAVERGFIKDEEKFLMGLDRTLTFMSSLNLTDMADDEAKRRIGAAVREINSYYDLREPWVPVKRIAGVLREKGLAGTAKRVIEKIRKRQ